MRTLIGSLALLGGFITLSWLHAQEGDGKVPGLLQTLDGHSETVYAAAYSPDGKIVATGSFDQTIKLWDPVAPMLEGRPVLFAAAVPYA